MSICPPLLVSPKKLLLVLQVSIIQEEFLLLLDLVFLSKINKQLCPPVQVIILQPFHKDCQKYFTHLLEELF